MAALKCRAPLISEGSGISMLGPAMLEFADEQKKREKNY